MSTSDPPGSSKIARQHTWYRRKLTKKQTQARRKNAATARQALKRKRQADPSFATNPRGHPETLQGGKKGRTWVTQKKKRFLSRIQHWKNRLPKDHPARELGLTIDAFRAIEILEEDMTPAQRRRYRGALKRIKQLEAELEKMEEYRRNAE